MKSNRRDFLKYTGMAGVGIAGNGIFGGSYAPNTPDSKQHNQQFNMSGYAAPKLETVRIGVIGLGNRGSGALRRLSRIEGAEIKAICDLVPAKVRAGINSLKETFHTPDTYSGGENEWKKLCEREDIDLVYICTPWEYHTPMAVYAMETDNHAATEIPAAKTIDECWQLVETSERTRKHCMMLENVCYDFFEMVTLNMARQGFFGEIIHGEG
ncbi:MAG: Gfo/Idh/MocA family oxidoreductase, partial [Balneolales bacterium]